MGVSLTLLHRSLSLGLRAVEQQASSQARFPASAQGVPSCALKQQRGKAPFMATESFTESRACDKERTLRTLGFMQLPTPWCS